MGSENGMNYDALETLSDIPSWEWPENAADILLAFLPNRQANAEKRLLATELAGDYVVVNDEIVDALLNIIADASETDELRGKAAISLGPAIESAGLADPEDFEEEDEVPISEAAFNKIRDALKRLYADAAVPKLARRRILEASVRAEADWHAGAIRAAYDSGDPEWVLTAVFCMSYVRGFEKEIVQSLGSADSDVHYHAVEAAGSMGVQEAWPHISGLLKSKQTDKELLLAAIEAAGNFGSEQAEELLLKFANSKDEEIAEAAEEALSLLDELGDDEQWDDEEEEKR